MYANVLIPLAIPGSYHYSIPQDLEEKIKVGMRVAVPLGSKRFYTAVVIRIDQLPPEGVKEIKPILFVVDEVPLVSSDDIAFWTWIAKYYLCTEGEVLRTALPSALLPESHTEVIANPEYEASEPLPCADLNILDLIIKRGKESLSIAEIQKSIGRPALPSFLRLVKSGAIQLKEELNIRTKGKHEQTVALADSLAEDEMLLMKQIDLLHRAPKQQKLLQKLIALLDSQDIFPHGEIPLRLLCGNNANEATTLRALIRKGILIRKERLRKLTKTVGSVFPTSPLNPKEKIILPEGVSVHYQESIKRKEFFLEQQISQTYAEGKQVLLLSPESQYPPSADSLTERLCLRYGDRCQLYSSRQTASQRITLFQQLAQQDIPVVVIGNRSALFLPMKRLGLIIIDEEQEYAYKQQLLAPRYHARDAAIMLGQLKGAKVLITSETPSAETLYNMSIGKWKNLLQGEEQLRPRPIDIETVNMKTLYRQRRLQSDETISPQLETAVKSILEKGRRVVLIQNRRGYGMYVKCKKCNNSLCCPRCSVSLTYHKQSEKLCCHYCGYEQLLPYICPSCGNPNREELQPYGFGTERVAEEIKKLFPQAQILRIDSDIAKSKKRLETLLNQIETGNVDIIVGTQMMAALPIWHDIDLIGVINLDSILAFPDFRADEKAYQLLYQLAIRSSFGVKEGNTRMILQTNDPQNPFIEALSLGDYRLFIEEQLQERQACQFPPFTRLTTVVIRALDRSVVSNVARQFATIINRNLPHELITDIHTPDIERIDRYYIRQIILRRPTFMNSNAERQAIIAAYNELSISVPDSKKCKIHFDVDAI